MKKKIIVLSLSIIIFICALLLIVYLLFSNVFKPLSERVNDGNKYQIVRDFTLDNISDFIAYNKLYYQSGEKHPSIVCIMPNDEIRVNVMPGLVYIFTLLHYIVFSILLIILICKKKFLEKLKITSYVMYFSAFFFLTLLVQIYSYYVVTKYEYIYSWTVIIWLLYIIMSIFYCCRLLFNKIFSNNK